MGLRNDNNRKWPKITSEDTSNNKNTTDDKSKIVATTTTITTSTSQEASQVTSPTLVTSDQKQQLHIECDSNTSHISFKSVLATGEEGKDVQIVDITNIMASNQATRQGEWDRQTDRQTVIKFKET